MGYLINLMGFLKQAGIWVPYTIYITEMNVAKQDALFWYANNKMADITSG